ncbi:MAG: NAD(P)/FAD-dependent oxidoreductase [Proteobacteria bacterium]|nr:NAD(P)/FAD-dependent oxidoreductase [Pseudomonadota bacterium]
MKHVVLGAGPAGVIAAETLRRADPGASVTLVCGEAEAPYSRMALPYLLAEDVGEEGTHLRHGERHYDSLGIELRQGRVASVSPDKGEVTLEDGNSLSYDRLLIATGSRPARPPVPGMDLDGVVSCWTLADARRIAAGTKPGSRVVLMGAGFIGCIVLEALASRGVELTVVEMEDRMLPRMMDDAGAAMIKRWCEAKGVTVLTSTAVQSVEAAGKGLKLDVGGNSLEADLVVCATGVRPNIEFLEGSGIETDQGILVSDRLQTNKPGIYAAGDVAQGPDFSTGEQMVHAIQPTASEHGRIAAANMAGADTPYRGSLIMNVLNTVGLITASYGLWQGVKGGDQVVVQDKDAYKYLRLEFDGNVLIGSLSLGLTQHVGVLRGLIQTKAPLGPWKARLMQNPHLIMEAYLECAQGQNVRAHPGMPR